MRGRVAPIRLRLHHCVHDLQVIHCPKPGVLGGMAVIDLDIPLCAVATLELYPVLA